MSADMTVAGNRNILEVFTNPDANWSSPIRLARPRVPWSSPRADLRLCNHYIEPAECIYHKSTRAIPKTHREVIDDATPMWYHSRL